MGVLLSHPKRISRANGTPRRKQLPRPIQNGDTPCLTRHSEQGITCSPHLKRASRISKNLVIEAYDHMRDNDLEPSNTHDHEVAVIEAARSAKIRQDARA